MLAESGLLDETGEIPELLQEGRKRLTLAAEFAKTKIGETTTEENVEAAKEKVKAAAGTASMVAAGVFAGLASRARAAAETAVEAVNSANADGGAGAESAGDGAMALGAATDGTGVREAARNAAATASIGFSFLSANVQSLAATVRESFVAEEDERESLTRPATRPQAVPTLQKDD